MKKTIKREEVFCDYCAKGSYEKCLGCKKDICWDCQKTKGIDFKHSVHFSGSGDGFYCNECLGNKEVTSTPLFKAYKEINNLRNEQKNWYDDFRKRADTAENHLKLLTQRP